MQISAARTLNKILLLFSAVILALFAGIFAVGRYWPGSRNLYLGGFAFVSIILALYYKYLEDYWDKRIITRMAKSGKIALMHIISGKRLMLLRDTSFRSYWIYELEGELWNRDHVAEKKTFQEKMNKETGEIPRGFVFVTWDEKTPRRIFIIPNIIIGNLPNLLPLVSGYEKDAGIGIKYLDAHYNRGMVLKTYGETIMDYKAKKK